MAKSTKSSEGTGTGSLPSFLPGWAPGALWGIALGTIAAGLVVWVPRLVERTAAAPLPSPVRVVLKDEPRWLPKDERSAIERSVVKSIAASPFDRDGLAAARDAVARSGWMTSVAQVRRSDVDEVIVEGTWAVPFALVCDGDGEHLVDARGGHHQRGLPLQPVGDLELSELRHQGPGVVALKLRVQDAVRHIGGVHGHPRGQGDAHHRGGDREHPRRAREGLPPRAGPREGARDGRRERRERGR
jgi:hypothetical protein